MCVFDGKGCYMTLAERDLLATAEAFVMIESVYR